MTWVAAAIATSAVIGGYSADRATNAQERAIREDTAAQERMFNRQVELQEPFRQVGVNALPELVEASKYKPFTYEDFIVDPGYRFRLQEGLKALDRTAAARGGLLGGNQLRGITQFGQDLASQEFGNAFNRYNIGFQNRLNPLQSLTGMGQTTTNTLANQAGQYGNTMAANAAQMGNIRASSYMGGANALTGGIGQYLNYRQNQDMMKMYGPRQYAEPTYDELNAFSQQQYPR